MRVRVYHGYYGCESGCCGHWVQLGDDLSNQEVFDFDHPETRADAIEFAKATVRDTWPECFDSIDWASLVFEPEGC